jgi:hypothetical protein
MATLYLDHVSRSILSLREWLDGAWGLLLSHPADFEDHSLESDRWLQIVTQEFHTRGVRPIVCRRGGGELDNGWVGRVSRDQGRVRLTHREVADMAARRLRDTILAIPASRFVVVVDPTLTHRRTWIYGTSPPTLAAMSPLDLLGTIKAMGHGARPRSSIATTWSGLSPAVLPGIRDRRQPFSAMD